MGPADYCALVVILLAGLVTLSIRQEEKRCRERRQHSARPPQGIERRSGRDRRRRSFGAWMGWAVRSQWQKLRSWL